MIGDPGTYSLAEPNPLDSRLLNVLNGELASRQTEVEFYFLGGAVISQAFNASPATAHIDAMFKSAEVVQAAVRDVAGREGVPEDWLQRGVRSGLSSSAHRRAYVEMTHINAFAPPPEYVLAVKCAAMRLGEGLREIIDDVRYVLRTMNVTSTEQALSIVTRYFSERQLVPDIRTRLEEILGG